MKTLSKHNTSIFEDSKSWRFNSKCSHYLDENYYNQFGDCVCADFRLDNMMDRSVHKEGIVYVVKCNEYYKIGMTRDYSQRMNTLKVSNPYNLKTVLTINTYNPNFLERHLHNKFSNKKHKGEWFLLNKQDIYYMGNLSFDYFNLKK